MKQLIVFVIVFFAAATVAVPVSGQQINHHDAAMTLKKQFPQAGHVTWSRDGHYAVASFTMGDRNAIAYFDEEGKWLGSLRQIFYDELPLVVARSFSKRFDPAMVVEIFEINNEEGTRYRLLLGSNTKKFEVIAFPDGYLKGARPIKQ